MKLVRGGRAPEADCEAEFFVKWKSLAHIHCQWVPRSALDIDPANKQKVQRWVKAMAQLAGVLLLRKLENTGKLAVLWSIDKVKLRGAVVPGDQLRIEVETIRARPQVGHVRARCKVAGKLVAEAELKFTLVDA